MINIRKYLPIPFIDRGRDFKGVDCWGLVYLIYKEELGIELPLYNEGYDKACSMEVEAIIDSNKSNWKIIEQEDALPFDTVLMRSILRTKDNKVVSAHTHVGIIVDKDKLLHCEENIGVSLVDLKKDKRIVNRIVGYFRYDR